MLDYEAPSLKLIDAKEINASVARLSSAGDPDSPEPSVSSFAEVISSRFALGEAPAASSSLNDKMAYSVCVLIEAFSLAINKRYADKGTEHCAWLFFRSLGSIVYDDATNKLFAWSVVAGPFEGLDILYTNQLGLDETSLYVIEKCVKAGHSRSDDKGIDFAHFCIVAATHLAVSLGYSTAPSFTKLVDFSSYGLSDVGFVKAIAGWLGDASLRTEGSMGAADTKADVDAAVVVDNGVIMKSQDAPTAIVAYYQLGANNRFARFMECLKLTKNQIIGVIFELLVYQGFEQRDSLQLSQTALELKLKTTYLDVYENFYKNL